MVTNEFERDLNDQAGLKRPGRVDFRVFQNTVDAGDGHPGVQRCFRNYLHEGGMEKDLNINNYKIINLAEPTLASDGARKSDVDAVQTDVDGFQDELKDLTQVEIQQLENIGDNTISNAQWGYVGVLNQNLRQADTPTFGGLTVNGNIIITGNVDGVDVSVLKTDFDTHKSSTGADHTYIDQSVITTASPTFIGLTLTNNLVTSSTVDSVDVSEIKLNSMPSAANGDIDANTQKIINVVDPVNDQDAATKKYVNEFAVGIASDDLVFSNDTERATGVFAEYTKLKEVTVYKTANIKVYWEMKTSQVGQHAYGKVYINSVAVGVEKTAELSTYQSYTDNVKVNKGDLLQIYVHSTEMYTAWVQNMRIKSADYESTDGY